LTFCPNLKFINYRIDLIIDCDKQFLPKIDKFSASLSDSRFDHLKTLSNKYCNQLKDLKLVLNFRDGKVLFNILRLISSFVGLENLFLVFTEELVLNLRPINSLMKEIALKCKQLNALYISLFLSDYQLICGNIFGIIGIFDNLKTFALKLPERVFNVTKNASVKSFKDCKKLSTLILRFNGLNDNFFKNAHIFVPNLRIIVFDTDYDLTDKSLNSSKAVKLLNKSYLNVL
jgi:hypothetical protein